MVTAIIPEIMEEHADETAFLFGIRDAAATAPHYDRVSLRGLDERIDAHLDGLRIGGESGLAVAVSSLDEEAPGSAFTVAVIAAERGDATAFAAALELAAVSRGAARGVVAGLAWVPFTRARGAVAPLLAPSASPLHRRIGIAVCAAHRQHPGEALTYALFDEDAALKSRALRAVGELGRVDLADALRTELAVVYGNARSYWAAWSAALLGMEAALPVLWSFADAGGPFAEPACALVMRRLEVREGRARLENLAAGAAHARTAIAGAAALGDPALVPWLLSSMENPALSRVAGEAFATITGARIEGPLSGPANAGFHAGPSDDPAETNVAMDPDGPLPWPAIAALNEWWSARGSTFRRGSRYLGGAALTPSTLEDEVIRGHQRRRAGAALELALRQPGRPLAEVRARVTSSR